MLFQLLLNFKRLQLADWQIDRSAKRLILTVVSIQASGQCPVCTHRSARVHSHYQRTVADLPWALWGVLFHLKVRKFFCDNGGCERHIFTERLPDFVAPWARRTHRLADRLTAIGLALGGAAGARLTRHLGIRVCRNTLLALIRRAPQLPDTTPTVLGVDDFAFRKRHTYGTVLIDQEKSQPIALLPDRTTETLTHWLRNHPGIKIITRDRAKAYAEAARQGAPTALQVADRFHLLQNLAETLDQVFGNHPAAIEAVNETNRQTPVILADGTEAVAIPPPASSAQARTRAEQRRAERRARFEQVWALHRQGWHHDAIARHLGISKRTIIRYLHSEVFPEHKHRRDRGRSVLDPYKAYVRERWNAGCRNAAYLLQTLKARGYAGSYATLASYTRRLRRAQSLSTPLAVGPVKVAEPKQPPLTARSAAWLVMRRPEQCEAEHHHMMAQLKAQHAELALAIDLAHDFAALVRNRCPDQLDPWLARAGSSSSVPFRNFANGLRADYDAVKAGVTVPWSNGPVEGHVNRLKMIKRTMFGRAKLDLLSQRFLLAA